jgi:hypothetical protein
LFISSYLAIVVLLALYQLFVYGSSFHDWLYSLVLFILAKAICLMIAGVDELPSGITEATSSIVQVSRSLLSRISKCFGFWSDRKNAISSETLLAFYQDLNRQTLGKKSIKSFRRKRCVSPWAKYKHAAEKFKAEHDHWHAIFENGIADLHQQISDYTQLETQLRIRIAACAAAKKSLSDRMVELATATLEAANAPTAAPVPRAAPPQSNPINQEVCGQILSTGARKIKKPISRRKKLAPVDIAPVNEGDNSLPAYGGYNAFDEILAESSAIGRGGGSTYDVKNADDGVSKTPVNDDDILLTEEDYAAFDEFLARGDSYGQSEDST